MQGRQAQAVAEVQAVLGVHASRHDVADHQQLGHAQVAHAAGGVVAGQDGAAKPGLVDAHLHDGRGGLDFCKVGHFVKKIQREKPKDKALHLIADNYATHKHPVVQDRLAKHPRITMHFTPTSASWLNMVERFFRDMTTEQLRRGVFTSVPQLIDTIDAYIAQPNKNPKPFIWTKSARDILQKVIRANKRLCSKQNATPH